MYEIGEQYRSYIEFEIVLGVLGECFLGIWRAGALGNTCTCNGKPLLKLEKSFRDT